MCGETRCSRAGIPFRELKLRGNLLHEKIEEANGKWKLFHRDQFSFPRHVHAHARIWRISQRVVSCERPVQRLERQSFNLSLLRISSDAATETINKDNTTNNDCTVSMA